jgi:hypothetical protein
VSIADARLRAADGSGSITAAAFAEAIEDAAMQAGITVASTREVSASSALQSSGSFGVEPHPRARRPDGDGRGSGAQTVTTPTAGEAFSPEPLRGVGRSPRWPLSSPASRSSPR